MSASISFTCESLANYELRNRSTYKGYVGQNMYAPKMHTCPENESFVMRSLAKDGVLHQCLLGYDCITWKCTYRTATVTALTRGMNVANLCDEAGEIWHDPLCRASFDICGQIWSCSPRLFQLVYAHRR
jgi:hypothetical protein